MQANILKWRSGASLAEMQVIDRSASISRTRIGNTTTRSTFAGLIVIAATAMLVSTSIPALAHGDAHHAPKSGPVVKQQTDWGVAGEARRARRTIRVEMSDAMRFTPDKISVRLGETVRFIARNNGRAMHEFVIGTREENQKHAELMKKFPDMEHDEPYMAHVAPGKTGEIVWTFNRPGEFEFACLIAGHYDAGMHGALDVNVMPKENRHAR